MELNMEINLDIANNLTKDEQALFDILLDVQRRYAPGTTLRVCGGWVRDRLMGKQSHDIDLMIDNMSGEKFAKLVTNHMKIDDPHVIKANPDASKHLETAGAFIPLPSGTVMDLDFARARKEDYADPNSRNPEIRPATAKEDAFRRDLTIGTLFYNIHTQKVEDFTGMGLSDLRNEVIRTPLDPLLTFQQDPLRIFRTIRFAARYGWSIDPKTAHALADPSLRDQIKRKITKERIQEEMSKMFVGANPVQAAKLLRQYGLLEDIISEAIAGTKYEGQMASLDMDQNNPYHELNLWDHTIRVLEEITSMYSDKDPEKRLVMILAALLHDLGKLYFAVHVKKENPSRTSYHGHEHESAEIAEAIMRYLKFSNDMIEKVKGVVRYHMYPHRFIQDEGITMKGLRRFIRTMGENSLSWLDVFCHALADAKAKGLEVEDKIVQEYANLEVKLQEALSSMSFDPNISTVPPVLNGNEVMQILNIKPGPEVGQAITYLHELQDDDPTLTPEEAAESLRKRFSQRREASVDALECPMHLISQKAKDIFGLIDEGKCREAISVINQLRNEYGHDENIVHLVSHASFECALVDSTLISNSLLAYIFHNAGDSFFDPAICCYAFGLAMLKETKTPTDVITVIGKRMHNMSPHLFKKVLKSLAKKKIQHPEVYKEFIV